MAMPVPPDLSTRWRPADFIIAGLLILVIGGVSSDSLAVRLLGGAVIAIGFYRSKL